MTCTNKQQETAECEKRGCDGCAYNEKTADEMFEELGYKVFEETEYFIEYKKQLGDCSKFIRFDLSDKTFTSFYYVVIDKQSYLSMQELQAINKKVQELGWKG